VRSILRHREGHRTGRIGWLRAAVLGANDGIVYRQPGGRCRRSGRRSRRHPAGRDCRHGRGRTVNGGRRVRVGQLSGRYRRSRLGPRAERARSGPARRGTRARRHLCPARRGLEPGLARTVAQQLVAHDALGAHARDELGLSDKLAARPLQAALASAATFAVGALLPILAVMLPPLVWVVPVVSGASLACLAALGALATQVGGGSAWRGAMRVAFWGALAMVATAGVGALFGTTVS
jgi:vacuolar iron transporter family protein